MMQRAISKKRELTGVILIFVAALLVFAPAVRFEFINFDDPYFVYENVHVKNGITAANLQWAFFSSLEGNWIPLTWISHMLDVQLFGLRAGMHHLVNILLHAASSGLFFLFLHRVSGSVWRSAVAALLFAFHPLHVESVAWVAERKDVLSCFFLVLTLLAYHRYALLPNIKNYLLSLLLCAFGLMSKSMLVTTPLLLLILDYYPLRRNPGTSITRLLFEKVPFVALSACAGVITYVSHSSANGIIEQNTLWDRIARSLVSYQMYLQKAFLPLDLAVIYPYDPYPPTALQVGISVLVLFFITAAAWCLRHKIPFFLVGWFWFVISLLPVIGLVQIGDHAWADRYFYIPSIGLLVSIVWGVSTLLDGDRWRGVRIAVTGVSLVTAVVLTSLQLQRWKDSITLFNHTIQVTVKNGIAHYNLGLALYYRGKVEESIVELRKSIAILPLFRNAYLDLGIIYWKAGDFGHAEEMYKKMLSFGDARNEASLALGRLYLDMKDIQKALAEYGRLKLADPTMAGGLLSEIEKYSKQNNTNR